MIDLFVTTRHRTKPSPRFTGNPQPSSISGFHLSVPREVTGESPKCPEVPFGVWLIIWNQNGHHQVFEWASLLSCLIWWVRYPKLRKILRVKAYKNLSLKYCL